jgi:predicted RND superfamily exporter protein
MAVSDDPQPDSSQAQMVGLAGRAAALSRLSVRHRGLIFALSLLALMIGAAGTLQLGFNPDARVYFSADSAERTAFEQIEQRYGRRQHLIVLSVAEPGDNGTKRAQNLASSFAAKVEGIDGVVAPALDDTGMPLGLDLHARDGGASTAVFELRITASGEAVHRTVKALESRASDAISEAGSGQILFTGNPGQIAASMDAILGDLLFLVPLQVVIIIGLLLIFTGSVLGTLVLLCVLAVASAFTMGAYGWLGGTLNGVTTATPSALLGLSVATSVHLLFGWQGGLRRGLDAVAALERTVAVHVLPVLIATLTTIISFLCLNLADSPAFATFGTLVACGLALTFVLSFTLLPALMSLLPATSRISGRSVFEALLSGLARLVIAGRVVILLIAAGLIGLSVWGIGKVVFEDRFTAYFDESYPYQRATQFYENEIGGVTPVLLSLPRGAGESLASPDYLTRVAALTGWLENQPEVTQVRSLSVVLRRGAGPALGIVSGSGVPNSAAMADSIETGLRGRSDDTDLQWLLGQNFAQEEPGEGATKIMAVLRDVGSSDIIDFAARARAELQRIAPEQMVSGDGIVPTGLPLLASQLSERNGQAMIRATPLALVAISIILIFALRSLGLGLASLLPNLMPLLMAYGAWGLTMGELTFAGTMVIAMTFGIVVDDTVHMMARYRHFRQAGLAPEPAMQQTFETVGLAVFATTVAIATGYIALGFSGFVVNRDLGLITTLTLFSALISAVVFLPALVLMIDRDRNTKTGTSAAAQG